MPTYHDPRDPHEDEVRCSFCGKTRSQVRKLVQGPEGVFICDECIRETEARLPGHWYGLAFEPVLNRRMARK